jgi:GTPase
LKKSGNFYVSASPKENAFLVGIYVRGSRPLLSVEDSLEELALLADTAGMEVVGQTDQSVHQIDPSTFVGSGKVNEIGEAVKALNAQVVIFDDELSPRHQRELEKRLGEEIKVLDRSALILDIFAQHAQTREGSLQVELAQYEYRLPRLTRQWTHLARQAGGGGSRSGNAGVGLRGPGETQLEVDRREIGRKISKLKEDLEEVKQHRNRHRQNRIREGVPLISLAGYTNAGKSTLLQAMTGSSIYTADQLFATLDPTTRRLYLPSNRHVVMTDTVGFIQKLPTTLIAAFRATLEEIIQADLILHVVDASHASIFEHIEAVEDTFAELNVPNVPRILVCNKIDMMTPEHIPALLDEIELTEFYTHKIPVSARTGQNIDQLLDAIEETLTSQLSRAELLIPYERGDIVSMLFEGGNVETQEHTQHGVHITAQLPRDLFERLEQYQIKE